MNIGDIYTAREHLVVYRELINRKQMDNIHLYNRKIDKEMNINLLQNIHRLQKNDNKLTDEEVKIVEKTKQEIEEIDKLIKENGDEMQKLSSSISNSKQVVSELVEKLKYIVKS